MGLEAGREDHYTVLTENNKQERQCSIKLFAIIFLERKYLNFCYDSKCIAGDVCAGNVSWLIPQEYLSYTLSLYFQHRFSSMSPAEESNSCYSLEHVVGFEDDQNISYTTRFDIFLEITNHFLLKSSLFFILKAMTTMNHVVF